MGILQLARVLHVVIATHFWGYRSKSGISVSEITLGIAGMPNRIADNFNGVHRVFLWVPQQFLMPAGPCNERRWVV